MRKLMLVGVLVLTGCGGNVTGPFQQRDPQRADQPGLPIAEQQRRARATLALPDESSTIAPHSGAAMHGMFGR